MLKQDIKKCSNHFCFYPIYKIRVVERSFIELTHFGEISNTKSFVSAVGRKYDCALLLSVRKICY